MPAKNVIQQLQEELKKEQETITAELTSIAKPDPTIAGNWEVQYPQFEEAESGSHTSREEEEDEVEEYEVRLAAEQSLESRLFEVHKALTRIREGNYGICKQCGKEIPLERLQANPAAEFDMEHSRE